MLLLELYLRQVAVFVLVLTRVSGLVMTAPVFGSRNVPLRVRAFLAIALAFLITPLQGGGLSVAPGNLLELLVFVGARPCWALPLGLAVMIVFTGLQLTGQIIGQMGGISLAEVVDPTFEQIAFPSSDLSWTWWPCRCSLRSAAIARSSLMLLDTFLPLPDLQGSMTFPARA